MLSYFSNGDVKLRKNLLFGIELAQQMSSVPVHFHEFIELAFVASGTGLHIRTGLDSKTQLENLLQGDLFIIQTGEIHGYEHCGNMVLYNIFIRSELLNEYQMLRNLPGWNILFAGEKNNSGQVIHLSVSERTQLTQCLDKLLDEYLTERPGSETMCRALFSEFLVMVLRSEKSWRRDFRISNDVGIIETIRMLEQRPEKHYTLKQLADAAHKSVTSYTKKFREITGLSPMEYLLKIRIQQALHYLKAGDLSIDEIAGKCGFCSANYMIKLFHRELGITPAKYRKLGDEA